MKGHAKPSGTVVEIISVVVPVVRKGVTKSSLAMENFTTGERGTIEREVRRELPFYNFAISTSTLEDSKSQHPTAFEFGKSSASFGLRPLPKAAPQLNVKFDPALAIVATQCLVVQSMRGIRLGQSTYINQITARVWNRTLICVFYECPVPLGRHLRHVLPLQTSS